MNRIWKKHRLKNRYFAIRHGESKANLSFTVCGDPKIGIDNYGLTPNGRRQVRESVTRFRGLNPDVLIYSSDFLRTKQSSKIIAETLRIAQQYIVLEPGLRERFFGEYEGLAGFDYEDVYNQEKETIESVLYRTSQVIADLEDLYDRKRMVLVSHADPIMILQTAFLGIDPYRYRQLPCIGNSEIRELVLIHP